jgi:hypothetical protein
VATTFQLYNYTAPGAYPTSGDGFMNDMIGTADVTKIQTITISPTQFRDVAGTWRVKIRGVKSTSTQFLMKVDWIDFQTKYPTTGGTIPYNAWQRYSLRATTASGDPIPYAYVSIYANGTSVTFRNTTDQSSIVNPAWVRLDATGTFQLEVKSASESAETLVLYAVVGSVVGQETIMQEAH